MYKIGDKVEYLNSVWEVSSVETNTDGKVSIEVYNDKLGIDIYVPIGDVQPYRTAHEKLIEMGLKLKITKNYADGVFSHEWWNDNDDRIIVFYIDEKVTTVYEGNNEIMQIIPQYLEELDETPST